MEQLKALVESAQRPLVLLGGTGWLPQGLADLRRWIEAWNLPATCVFRYPDTLDNRHPNYVGEAGIGINPKLGERIRDSDLLIAVGARLGEIATNGYTLIEPPVPRQRLVHVHADPSELGRVYQGHC